jgi:hypothetical protein
VLGAPIGLCSEEHELISREGPFSGSIIHIHRWFVLVKINKGPRVLFKLLQTGVHALLAVAPFRKNDMALATTLIGLLVENSKNYK